MPCYPLSRPWTTPSVRRLAARAPLTAHKSDIALRESVRAGATVPIDQVEEAAEGGDADLSGIGVTAQEFAVLLLTSAGR